MVLWVQASSYRQCDDRTPVTDLCQGLTGKLLADKGYLGEKLFEDGLELITNVRSKMKNKLIPLRDKFPLRRRFIIDNNK